MINPMELTGKHILVTGASAGIGKQTAITCAQLGAKVTIVARRQEQLNETLALLEGEGHSTAVADLSDIETIQTLIKDIVVRDGAFDGMVHCAGIATNRAVAQFTYAKLHSLMLINFYAFYELVRCITKKGCFNPGLSIVGLSSVASVRGNAAQSAYAASKGALDSAVRALARELHGKGIRINTVRPAMIRTEMFEKFSEMRSQEEIDKLLSRQYLGIGETTDVSTAIAFLLSNASKFVTGSAYSVDGGFTSSSG